MLCFRGHLDHLFWFSQQVCYAIYLLVTSEHLLTKKHIRWITCLTILMNIVLLSFPLLATGTGNFCSYQKNWKRRRTKLSLLLLRVSDDVGLPTVTKKPPATRHRKDFQTDLNTQPGIRQRTHDWRIISQRCGVPDRSNVASFPELP